MSCHDIWVLDASSQCMSALCTIDAGSTTWRFSYLQCMVLTLATTAHDSHNLYGIAIFCIIGKKCDVKSE